MLQEDDRIITQLLETIEDLMKQSPELFRNDPPVKPEKSLMTPTPPRRNRVSKYGEFMMIFLIIKFITKPLKKTEIIKSFESIKPPSFEGKNCCKDQNSNS